MSEEKVVSLEEYLLRKDLEKYKEKKKEAQRIIHEALVAKGLIDPEDKEE